MKLSPGPRTGGGGTLTWTEDCWWNSHLARGLVVVELSPGPRTAGGTAHLARGLLVELLTWPEDCWWWNWLTWPEDCCWWNSHLDRGLLVVELSPGPRTAGGGTLTWPEDCWWNSHLARGLLEELSPGPRTAGGT